MGASSLILTCAILLAAKGIAAPRIILFKASKVTVDPGQSTTLEWDVADAKEVSIQPGIGKVAKRSGKKTVSPASKTTYTLTALGNKGASDTASLTVDVALPKGADSRTMGLGRITGFAFLPRGVRESAGYGLYSYLLISGKTTLPQVQLAAVKAVINNVDPLKDFSAVPPPRLNVFHIPVEAEPSGSSDVNARARAILERYDFPRAKIILAAVGDKYQSGVYLVAHLHPVDVSRELPHPYLILDLSRAPPNLIEGWVKYFLSQAAKPEPWKEDTVKRFAAELRTFLDSAPQYLATAVILVEKKH